MSSGHSPWWRRFLQKYLKFLFIVCPEGNYHWRWDKFCFCCSCNESPIYVYCSGNLIFRGHWHKIGERCNWEVK